MNARIDATLEAAAIAELIDRRRTVLPKHLVEPGPDMEQLETILRAAASAPDHGELLPWRFVIVPFEARERLAQVFADSLLQRDASATADQVEQARQKAFRAPVLMLAIVTTSGSDTEVPPHERLISAGCAIQNILLMTTALGFASALTSGKALAFEGLARLFCLSPEERPVCFINIGTASRTKAPRIRPEPAQYVSFLGE
ncbi:nitroreductase [Caenimonas sp. SL110]|uniref:nitroreductase family protein n=1 Tax=Caenimonas sp. SL110 TaxID=1450524 RepID=UPI000652F4FE|nr:nitroreductase [Caenimonas sp. SL110]